MNSIPARFNVSVHENEQPHLAVFSARGRIALALCAHLDVSDLFAVAGRAAATELAKLAAVANSLPLFSSVAIFTTTVSPKTITSASSVDRFNDLTNVRKLVNVGERQPVTLSFSVFVHFWFCFVLILVLFPLRFRGMSQPFPRRISQPILRDSCSTLNFVTRNLKFNLKFGSST
jgi:hypothetical protein